MRQILLDGSPSRILVDSALDPGLIWASAILVTLFTALHLARRHGLSTSATLWAAMFGVCGAILGGSAWTVAFGATRQTFDVASILGSPKSVLGAIVGAGTVGALYLRTRRLPVLKYADATVAAAFLGYAVARVGCFINGCCFGIPTELPWGVRYPATTKIFATQLAEGYVQDGAAATLPVHPTQLYQAALGFVGFVLLMRISDVRRGTRLATALVMYGAARFFIEFLRGDSARIVGGLDLNQFACLMMVLTGMAVWAARPVTLPHTVVA